MSNLGQVVYDIVAKDKTAEGLGSAGDRAQKIGKIAGTAMTGIGVAMIALTNSAKKTNATIKQTALQLGTTAEEMRELTLATTNVTFPISEVTASFDLLTRAGMEDKDAIAATATAFDTLGDATGKTASEIIRMMVPAFNAFNIPLEKANEYTDLFTHLQRNTTVELESFSGMVNYLAADLDTMDLSLENSIAVMEALADKGIQGSSATREFRTAVTAADGDVIAFYEALGLTEGEVAKYTAKLSEAEGMTKEYAAAANTQYGTVDKLKQKVSELTLKYGSLLEPLDSLGPILSGLGPMILTYTMLQSSAAAAGTTLTASIWATTAALLANPLTWVVVGVAALIAVLVILEKKFGLLTKTSDVLSDGLRRLIDWFKDKLAPGIEFVHAIVARFGDKLLFLLGPIGGVIWGLKKLHGILKDNKEVAETATDSWDDLQMKLKDTEGEMGDAAMSLDEITDAMRTLEPEIDEYETLLGDAKHASEAFARAQKHVKDSAEDVDTLTVAYEDLRRAVESLEDLTENQEDQARAIEHAEWGLKDAQDAYNEAIEEHGEGSEEAARANLRLRDAQDRLEDAQERQIDIIAEIAEADTEKQRILSENNVTNLTEFETLLETKRTEYDAALRVEQTAREAHETIMNAIAEREADTQIAEWMRMKEEMEASPIKRQVITEFVTKGTEALVMEEMEWAAKGSYQYGGIVPGPIGAPVPIVAHGGERFLGSGGGGAERPPIEVKIETTIYNYSDVETLEKMIAEAVNQGIHDAYSFA